MERRISYILLAISLIFFASCKKNDDTEQTKNYLDGNLKIDGQYSFVEVGSAVEFRITGVSHPEASSSSTGHHLGLCYKVNGLMDSYDTLYNAHTNPLEEPLDVTLTIHQFEKTDTLGSFPLSVFVYPEDSDKYYSSSISVSITSIDPGRSIPELIFNPSLPYVTDFRGPEELSYNYTEHDNNGNPLPDAWMTRNMSYLQSGRGYSNVDGMSYLFGRYYTYEEALDACPDGWRLPSDNDWAELANAVAGTQSYKAYADFKGAARYFKKDVLFNGNGMWEFWPDAPALGTSGLCVIPVGYCNAASENSFSGYSYYACFWTSDVNPDEPGQALYRYFASGDDDVKLGSADMGTMAISVRCVAE